MEPRRSRTILIPVVVAVVVAVLAACAPAPTGPGGGTGGAGGSGPGGSPGLGACPLFPPDNVWHADVSALPVHPRSTAWRSSVGSGSGLKADFGSGLWDGGRIGIPWTGVDAGQPRVPVSFAYSDESDPGPYPIPADAPV
jgi:hypothetical protein